MTTDDQTCSKCGKVNTVCTNCPGFEAAYSLYPQYMGDIYDENEQEYKMAKNQTNVDQDEGNYFVLNVKENFKAKRIGPAFAEIQDIYESIRYEFADGNVNGYVIFNGVRYDLKDILLD